MRSFAFLPSLLLLFDLYNSQFPVVNINSNDNGVSRYLQFSKIPPYSRDPFALETKLVNFSLYTNNSGDRNGYSYLMQSNEVYITLDSNSSYYSQLQANLSYIYKNDSNINYHINFTPPVSYVTPYVQVGGQNLSYFNNIGWTNAPYYGGYDIDCSFNTYDMFFYQRRIPTIRSTNITNYKSLSFGIGPDRKLRIVYQDFFNLTESNFFDTYNHPNFTNIRNLTFDSVKVKKNFILLQSISQVSIIKINDYLPGDFYDTSFTLEYLNNSFFIPYPNVVHDFDMYGSVLILATSSGLIYYTNDNKFNMPPYNFIRNITTVSFNNTNYPFYVTKLFITKDTMIALMPSLGIKSYDISYLVSDFKFNASYSFSKNSKYEFYHPRAFTMDDFINSYTGKSFIGLGIDQFAPSDYVPEFFIEFLVEGQGVLTIFKVYSSFPRLIKFDNIRSDDWYTYIFDKLSRSLILIKRGRNPNIPNTIYRLNLTEDSTYDFDANQEAKAYLIYDKFSGNYSVIYTNSNTTRLVEGIYELDASMDCFLYTPGVYGIVFSGKAEICDPLKYWDVQNYCAINSYITINALSGNSQDGNGTVMILNDGRPPIVPIIVGVVLVLIVLTIAGVITFKYKCFTHLCKKQEDLHPHTQLPKDNHDESQRNEIEVHVDQK